MRAIPPPEFRRPPPGSGRRGAKRQRSVRIPAVFWLLTACSGSEREASIDLSITHYELLNASSPPVHLQADRVAVTGGAGSVEVTGAIRLPDHCDALRAHLVDRRPDLEVRLRYRPSRRHRGDCDEFDHTPLLGYTAEIGPLPPGRYHLRILEESHREHGRWWPSQRPDTAAAILHQTDVLVH